MHDLKSIRENPQAFDAALARRGLEPMADKILKLDEQGRGAKTELQQLQARRNDVAKQIGQFIKSDPAKAEALKAEAAEIKEKLAVLESGDNPELTDMLMRIPNILSDDVPEGKDESANQEIRRVGTKPAIKDAKDHVALGEGLGLMDFETAAKISGSRFVITTGPLARLERALASFMLDVHTGEFGYTETNPPILVRDNALKGTGQLPKFSEDLFSTDTPYLSELRAKKAGMIIQLAHPAMNITESESKAIKKENEELDRQIASEKYYLIPTAEVSLTNIVNDSIIEESTLPRRYTAHTPCFRSEAGAAGRDTRGMIRQHQFTKVELVSITKPEDSAAEHERMTACAEEILKRLGLHYRVMLLCAGDTGFGARKTYDIEVWLPGQDNFREISSCSNCGDFQARRMKARLRAARGNAFVHTLNGSGLAVGRTLIAVLENYQQPDGSIKIPDVLLPYMGGLTHIKK